jgi:predicted dehydrogenase
MATGYIADLFSKDLVANGHRIAAVGSRSTEAAQRFAHRFQVRNAHGSYEALVADPAVDAVYIATPHPMHHAGAIMALEHGKHVLVEKPFTLNARQAAEIIELGNRKRLVVQEAMWTRFLPHMVRMREILASGVLGQIRAVIADHTQDLPDDPAHRLNAPELGGGALLDLGIYPISLTFDVLGQPRSVQSNAVLKATGVDGAVATLFGYDSGAVAVTLSGSDTAGPNVASVMGTAGRIDIGAVWYLPAVLRVYDSAGTLKETFEAPVKGRGMHYQAIEVERLITSRATEGSILAPSETLAIMKCLDTIRAQIGLRYPED